jgi:hypothetical protein
MNINWVLADNLVLDPTVNVDTMKNVGSLWGSWKTWRGCSTDNVVCHNLDKAGDLIKRDFHKGCNFYIANETYTVLGRPAGVKLYEGKFVDEFQPEEVIAMHLAASVSDIILLVGFDWTKKERVTDKLIQHRANAYFDLIYHAVKDNPQVQWVLVDHVGELDPKLAELPNLTQDTMATAFSLLQT